MSVRVNIEYRQPNQETGEEETLASRVFDIRRADIAGNHGNEHETRYSYVVTDLRRHVKRDAVFLHRYGDDLIILVDEAGAAIRDKYGNI